MQTHFNTSISLPSSIVAIGAFDGVHQGHQVVIKQAVEKAKSLNVPSVIYTFDPPPRVYFQGATMLTPILDKVNRIKKLGVDHIVVLTFDEVYASKRASEFITTIAKLSPKEIYVGDDFKFGKGREGDISLLKQYFNVHITDPVCCSSGKRISSTRIRALISEGNVSFSSFLLGWPQENKTMIERSNTP